MEAKDDLGEFAGHFVASADEEGCPIASFGDEWRYDLLAKTDVANILSRAAQESEEWAIKFAEQVFDHGAVALHFYARKTERGVEVNVFDCACNAWTRGGGGNIPS